MKKKLKTKTKTTRKQRKINTKALTVTLLPAL